MFNSTSSSESSSPLPLAPLARPSSSPSSIPRYSTLIPSSSSSSQLSANNKNFTQTSNPVSMAPTPITPTNIQQQQSKNRMKTYIGTSSNNNSDGNPLKTGLPKYSIRGGGNNPNSNSNLLYSNIRNDNETVLEYPPASTSSSRVISSTVHHNTNDNRGSSIQIQSCGYEKTLKLPNVTLSNIGNNNIINDDNGNNHVSDNQLMTIGLNYEINQYVKDKEDDIKSSKQHPSSITNEQQKPSQSHGPSTTSTEIQLQLKDNVKCSPYSSSSSSSKINSFDLCLQRQTATTAAVIHLTSPAKTKCSSLLQHQQQQQPKDNFHSNLPILSFSSTDTSGLSLMINENSGNNNRNKSSRTSIKMDNQIMDIDDKMRLIKSQSLKFEPNQLENLQQQQINSRTKNTKRQTKLEPSKSLDMVDDQALYNVSKLPRSLTLSCKKLFNNNNNNLQEIPSNKSEPLFDVINNPTTMVTTEKTIENISRSSTASLGLLSNLNDVLTINDISDDESLVDLRSRLTAIDESSLSPLTSLNSIADTNVDQNSIYMSERKQEEITADIKTITTTDSINSDKSKPEPDFDDELPLSLNSIEIQETNYLNNDKTNDESKLIKSKIAKNPSNRINPVNINLNNDNNNKSIKSNKMNVKQTATRPTLHNNASSVANYNRTNAKRSNMGIRNIDKNSASKPCSANGSRCTTPALSESDSLSAIFNSNHSKSNGSAKMLSNIININDNRRLISTRNNFSGTTRNSYQKTVNGQSSNLMKRSTTYTRSLNQATAQMARTKENNNNIVENNNNDTTGTRSDKSQQKSFAKPTTSYLRKAAAAATIPRRPSSVLSNGNTNNASILSSKTTTTTIGTKNGNYIGTTTFGPKRSPTITLLNTLATSNKNSLNSNSVNSSRRSSVTSPANPPPNLNTSKKDILNQLQYYENLCFEKTEQIKKIELELKQSILMNQTFLVLYTFILNEYRPFETPKLRVELLTAHQKCSTLHRNYELAKEVSFQKQTQINSLMTNIEELTKHNEELKRNINSVENQYNELKQEIESNNNERKRLETELQEAKTESSNEKQIRMDAEKRLEKIDSLLRTDKKYRELKEKISNYEKEVDSLNVVVDMKTQRIRHLESEKMRTELELADYEQLKESYQRLQRENEALTEALGMKARKNAEQSRELDILRNELKRETNERKRLSVRYDQLEFQFNESRDLLNNLSTNLLPINEESNIKNNPDPDESCYYTPMKTPNTNYVETSNRKQAKTGGSNSRPNAVCRLFSTPLMNDAQFKSRYHYQHQDPVTFGPNPDSPHRLPEVVLSSMNCRSLHKKMISTTTTTSTTTTSDSNSSSLTKNINGHKDMINDAPSNDSSLTSNIDKRNRTLSE